MFYLFYIILTIFSVTSCVIIYHNCKYMLSYKVKNYQPILDDI